ncbi:hypothetical protein GCM10027275_37180 [Rhabdobacter roseus]|uniref:Secretion system C-terminal sorting domain-containing protein n=1 Tax=Rhabdobacter roseus TaxID=1655419 RepID=A0A840TSL3_9BACT|nr:T9SS type A sorting domain-containing protein [Rhabdobacter roseus]MBB5285875.1 hypothetical protein [Rhabdobacter roseus]
MKKICLLGLLMCLSAVASATHLMGGEIQAKHLNGFTYEITVILYLNKQNGGAAVEAQEQVLVCLENTENVRINRTSTEPMPGVAFAVKCTYRTTYTFAAPGTYTIRSILDNRTNNILNVNLASPSQESSGVIQTTLNTNFPNTTPSLPNPVLLTGVRQVFTTPLATTDVDGDSLAYRVTRVLRRNGAACQAATPDPTYRFPNDLTQEGTFRAENAALIWNAPTRVGSYLYALVMEEWRQGVKISETLRESLVLVTDQGGTPVTLPPYEVVGFHPSDPITSLTPLEFTTADMALNLYPVPSEEWLHVEVQSRRPASHLIELLNVQGRTLDQVHFTEPAPQRSHSFRVGTLPQGVYLIRVRGEQQSLTRKFVK